MMSIDEGLQGKELYKFLVANKRILIAEKKGAVKHSDPLCISKMYIDKDGDIVKAAPPPDEDNAAQIHRMCAVNSCLIMDSHHDVHIPGIWKRSLDNKKDFYLIQEHNLSFKGVITDDVKAFTKKISWKALGVDAKGETETLIFDSTIPSDRNPFMFYQYKANRVKEHSVSMRYISLALAINDEDNKEEYAVWQKYIDNIVNKDEVEKMGFFWAVKEAAIIEGSAVLYGSNYATPVLNSAKANSASHSSMNTDTHPNFDLSEAIKQTKFLTH